MAPASTSGFGNPAPLGLAFFAWATILLGLLDAGVLEKEGKETIASVGFWGAGLGQIFTSVISLYQGNTFAYLVFGFYGCLWVILATVWQRVNEKTNVGAHEYPDAQAGLLIIVGFVSTFFSFIAFRHNKALPIALSLVAVASYLLAAGEYNEGAKKAGGVAIGLAGCTALYIMIGEITNEEFKREVVPGLSKPFRCCKPRKRSAAEKASVSYDKEANTLYVKVGNGQSIMNEADAKEFFDMVLTELKAVGHRVHAEVTYEGVYIADGVQDHWQQQVDLLERDWYMSVHRLDCTRAFQSSATMGKTKSGY